MSIEKQGTDSIEIPDFAEISLDSLIAEEKLEEAVIELVLKYDRKNLPTIHEDCKHVLIILQDIKLGNILREVTGEDLTDVEMVKALGELGGFWRLPLHSMMAKCVNIRRFEALKPDFMQDISKISQEELILFLEKVEVPADMLVYTMLPEKEVFISEFTEHINVKAEAQTMELIEMFKVSGTSMQDEIMDIAKKALADYLTPYIEDLSAEYDQSLAIYFE